MVQVRVSETYDLSTKVNKMGMVGIHTPVGNLIPSLWGGLIGQYKKFRFVKCDVAMACASMLPADPLQIGVEAGAIAPQDMFNPILYKAVSNESMSQLQAWLQMVGHTADLTGAFNKGSIVDVNDPYFQKATTTELDNFELYYALLSDSDGWRKAMPQAGLVMRDLYPLVYQVLNSYGGGSTGENPENPVLTPPVGSVSGRPSYPNGDGTSSFVTPSIRGPAIRMPAMDTTIFAGSQNTDCVPWDAYANVTQMTGSVPPAYVAMIILPPAKLNQLYYRLKVTWTIEFTGLRSLAELSAPFALANIGQSAYGTDYATQSAVMSTKLSMLDANGADVSKIMEGS